MMTHQRKKIFELSIRGVETLDFSLKLTQAILEINHDKASE